MALDPQFDPEEHSYTVSTTNATNKVTATSDDETAVIGIYLTNSTVTDEAVENGASVTWAAGENILSIQVTEDSCETGTYTVTVTKS